MRERERARRLRCLTLLMALGTIAWALSADGAEGICCDSAFRLRVDAYGFPVSAGNVRLEGALGFGRVSVAGWADVAPWPTATATLGGDLKLTRDWLSVGISATQGDMKTELSLQGRAAPPAWILSDGMPTVVGDVTAYATAGLRRGMTAGRVVVSPSVSAVIPVGDVRVTPSLGLELGVDSAEQTLDILNAHLGATITAGPVLIANNVYFAGAFDSFSSLVLSLYMPDAGITLSGSLIPTGGGLLYRVAATLEWGLSTLLLPLSDQPTTLCTGGVCF